MESEATAPEQENAADETEASTVSCHETKPGRTVFTEADNPDGWIATDLSVTAER